MINAAVTWPGVYENNMQNNGNMNGQDEDDEGHESDISDEENAMTEFLIVPMAVTENDVVTEIFNAMKHCQSLHPDPNDSVSDDDFMEANDEEAGAAGAMRNLNLEGK